MTRRVRHAEVRLDLAQPHRDEPLGQASHQQLAEKLDGHGLGGPLVESPFQGRERLDGGFGKG
ncbi:MAG: hypothetical protein AB2L07_12765 [Thermoanaerobaculaceae bacterium]